MAMSLSRLGNQDGSVHNSTSVSKCIEYMCLPLESLKKHAYVSILFGCVHYLVSVILYGAVNK